MAPALDRLRMPRSRRKSAGTGFLLVAPPGFDAGAYVAQIERDAQAQRDAQAARGEEDAARAEQLRAIAKYVPLVGNAFSGFVDLGEWLGKKLGGAYEDQYGPEDLQHVADEIAAWLARGWIPPNYLFTGKDGAKNFGNLLQQGRELAESLSNQRYAFAGDLYLYDDGSVNTGALRALGTLTRSHATHPDVAAAIAACGADHNLGSFDCVSIDPAAPKLIGALAAAEFGVDASTYQARARTIASEVYEAMRRRASINPHPIAPGAPFPTRFETISSQTVNGNAFASLACVADTFVATMAEASAHRAPTVFTRASSLVSAQGPRSVEPPRVATSPSLELRAAQTPNNLSGAIALAGAVVASVAGAVLKEIL